MAGKTQKNRQIRTVHVAAGGGYDVLIQNGILSDCDVHIRKACPAAEKAAVICDRNVLLPHAEAVCTALSDGGIDHELFVLESGEAHKNMQTYGQILEFLASARLSRSDCVVALGGGVTGDMAGFAAATYLRGISYVQIPTTLLAMVDSSVGGKTAIDLNAGKNLAGAFCQPSLVLCDPLALRTLPDDVFRDGCAEVLKYGVLYDRAFFLKLKAMAEGRTSGQSIKQALQKEIAPVIKNCVSWKRDVVEQDEFDRGERKKLNLGHTFGHGIERLSEYRISHGCAVAAGMAIMARAAAKKGLMPKEDAQLLEETLESFGLPTETDQEAAKLAEAARSDKKAQQQTIDLIVPYGIGDCRILRTDLSELQEWIETGLSW